MLLVLLVLLLGSASATTALLTHYSYYTTLTTLLLLTHQLPRSPPPLSSQVQAKLDDVKNVMVQNIENVLERGEKLELLVDKTDKLQHSAFSFHRSSKRLQRAMWLKKMKIYAIMFLGAGLLILFISMMICGADFSKCHSDGSGDDDSQR